MRAGFTPCCGGGVGGGGGVYLCVRMCMCACVCVCVIFKPQAIFKVCISLPVHAFHQDASCMSMACFLMTFRQREKRKRDREILLPVRTIVVSLPTAEARH
jgi:hypothetical protein